MPDGLPINSFWTSELRLQAAGRWVGPPSTTSPARGSASCSSKPTSRRRARSPADTAGAGRWQGGRTPAALALLLEERGVRVLVNCAPFVFNLGVMEAALHARCHYLDLGGLFHTTRMQLLRDNEFRRHGLLAVLGMGSAPRIVNVLARAAGDSLRRVRAIRIYNGGVDHTGYQAPVAFGFAPATVLEELTQPPMAFTRGRFRAEEPLSGGEDVRFEVAIQSVHRSLHSEVATLPLS